MKPYRTTRNKLLTLEKYQYEIKTEHRRYFVNFGSLCRMLRCDPNEVVQFLDSAGNFFEEGGSGLSDYILDSFFIPKKIALAHFVYDFLRKSTSERLRMNELQITQPLQFTIKRSIGGYSICITENRAPQVSLFFGADRIEAIEPKHIDTLIDSFFNKKTSKIT